MNCLRLILVVLPHKPQNRLLCKKCVMPKEINNLKSIKKKSAQSLTVRLKESNSEMLFWILVRLKLFCVVMKLFLGKNSKTATEFVLMCWMFVAKTKVRKSSCLVPVLNLWQNCLRKKFPKFMTAWLKLWAWLVIRVQKPKSPLKPMI